MSQPVLPHEVIEHSIIATASGRIIYFSESLYHIFDSDYTGRPLSDLFSDQIYSKIMESYVLKSIANFEAKVLDNHFMLSVTPDDTEIDIVLRLLDRKTDNDLSPSAAGHIGRAMTSSLSILLPLLSPMKKETSDLLTVAKMEKQLMRLLRLSKNIIDYSTYRAKTMSLRYSKQEIGQFFTELVENIRKAAATMPVTIQLTIPAEPVYCQFDKDKIERACLNIIANSLQSFHDGAGIITITVRYMGGNSITITFSDNGCGCSHESLVAISKKIALVDLNDPEFVGGAGLGIALSRAFFELHGSSSIMLSTPEQGTIVTVSLPLNLDKENKLSLPQIDYAGGFNHVKLELAQNLPPEAYL